MIISNKVGDNHNKICKHEARNASIVLKERIDCRRKSCFFIESEAELSETESIECVEQSKHKSNNTELLRDIECLVQLYNTENGVNQLTDREVMCLVDKHIFSGHRLESVLSAPKRAVRIRRQLIANQIQKHRTFDDIPHKQYDYSLLMGTCCENVVGYIPVPLGMAGPLLINNKQYFVPMATTEGCLVASTSRGCRAIQMSGGVRSAVYGDCMTRGPVVVFRSALKAVETMKWLEIKANFSKIKTAFESTSRFARLLRIESQIAGKYLYLRFVGTTGDAMGMNFMSKGTDLAVKVLVKHFPDIKSTYLSGNICTDKKSSAINWIEGRGKSVVCEAIVPAVAVKEVLKTSVDSLIECNVSKNLIGSALAGAIGGNNSHAANIVAAIYIACGQDPAQVVGSSQCITLMESHGPDLHVSTTMPAIEVGTIGGGTLLPAQSACLEILGVKGSSGGIEGSNACKLATIVCGTVLAAELSTMAALAAGHLVKSHMKHNRSKINLNLNNV